MPPGFPFTEVCGEASGEARGQGGTWLETRTTICRRRTMRNFRGSFPAEVHVRAEFVVPTRGEIQFFQKLLSTKRTRFCRKPFRPTRATRSKYVPSACRPKPLLPKRSPREYRGYRESCIIGVTHIHQEKSLRRSGGAGTASVAGLEHFIGPTFGLRSPANFHQCTDYRSNHIV
jgi:hypothetical protein